MPSPPSDVDTSIPPSSSDAPTMRDRVAVHLEDPTCAACHTLMDPIGLGLENFDGLGVWRLYENDVTIDPSGDLDGAPFDDAWGLAGALREHEDLAPCLVETVYRYAGSNFISEGEWDGVAWHAEGFALDEHRVLWLLRDVALGAGFRQVSPPSEELDTGEVR
jgi:hypothetical protein